MTTTFEIHVPNFVDDPDFVPLFGGGDWDRDAQNDQGSLDNLVVAAGAAGEFFVEYAVSVTAAAADTKFEMDLGQSVSVWFVGVPDGNAQAGTIRFEFSNTIAWSGFTVNGAHSLNATSLSVHNASGGSVTISAGQLFTVAGDDKVYQVTSGATISNGANGSLTIKRVDKSATGLAVAYAGSEVLTCRSGNYTSPVLDTGTEYWPMAVTPSGGFRRTSLPNKYEHSFTTGATARYVRCTIVDTSNTDGQLRLSGLYVCYTYLPAYNPDYGVQFGIKANTQRESAVGGGDAYQEERPQRQIRAAFTAVSQSEAFTTVADILYETDLGGNMWVTYDNTDSSDLKMRRSFPGRFDDLSVLTHAHFDGVDIPLSITERIA